MTGFRVALGGAQAVYNVNRGTATLDRLNEILEAPVTVNDIADPMHLNEFKDSISFENVGFSYQDDSILHNINLTVKKGKLVALVGSSGAGKSTLVKLLVGLYQPQEGEILMNGVNTAQIDMSALRNQISFVTQDTQLFAGTIKENLAFVAPAATEDDMLLALTKASCANILDKGGNGLATVIGEGGLKLSGGEKRRLHLLSILFKNPNFLVLDEPTNDLDLPTLSVLENFLMDFQGCLIIISHDRYFMDKIVDHLFVFRGEGEIEDFPGNYSDFRAYEDSAEPKILNSVSTEKTNWKEKQTASTGLSFNEQKEFNKIEKEIKDLEYNKKQIEQEFADGKVTDDKIEAKANELQKIIQTLEEKEERWFELSSKME